MANGGRRALGVMILACTLAVGAAACSDDDGAAPARASVPTAPPETTTSTTAAAPTTTEPAPAFEALIADPSLTPEQQVEAAYLYSWEIYLHALSTGTTEYLALVYVDPALTARSESIESLRTDGRRVEGSVEHDYTVALLDDVTAVVVDAYVNHLVLVDAATDEALEPDPNELVAYSYTLVLREGSWRIANIDRLSS